MIASTEMQTGAVLDMLWSFIARVEIGSSALDLPLLIRSLETLTADYEMEENSSVVALLKAATVFVRAEAR